MNVDVSSKVFNTSAVLRCKWRKFSLVPGMAKMHVMPLGGTIKSLCSSLVASDPDVIVSNALDMFDLCSNALGKRSKVACGAICKRRVFFLVKPKEIDRRMSSDCLKTIPGTRSVHEVKTLARNCFSLLKQINKHVLVYLCNSKVHICTLLA